MTEQTITAMAMATNEMAMATQGRIRYVAPTAALGTAAVMQVAVFTDTFGSKLATAMATHGGFAAGHTWLGYAAGLMLGLAVAACAEGGAAHLMSLYERHLLARDSTGLLRLGMCAYVAGSAWLIHWWLTAHHLPGEIAYALAAMTGSSIFLWSRSSRWRHRVAMRDAGQLDPALPRLPLAAKVMHPWRWIQTQWLISWEPVATTDEARGRYAEAVARRRLAKNNKSVAKRLAERRDTVAKPAVAKPVATKAEPDTAKSVATATATPDDGHADRTEIPDPWATHSVPIDPDRDLADWSASDRGREEVAMAKEYVATGRRPAMYDVAAVKAQIRRGLNAIRDDMPKAEIDAAKRRIDDRTAAAAGISARQARRLRSEVSGEPISGPPHPAISDKRKGGE